MANVHLLVNPAAANGRGIRVLPQVLSALEALGARVELHRTDSIDAAVARCRRIADTGERLIVAGGDGMVHLAAQVLAGTNSTLGVIPLGSGNDFARAMGLPLDDVVAASAFALGEARALDVLRCGEVAVASIATVGFSAGVAALANRLVLGPLSSQRYTVATALQLPRLAAGRYRVALDDGPAEEIDATLIAVANTAWFGGGMQIAPQASPTDGLAEVVVIAPVGRARLLSTFRLVFDGRHIGKPEVLVRRASSVFIEALEPARDCGLWGDGEHCGPLPMTVRVEKHALRVAAP